MKKKTKKLQRVAVMLTAVSLTAGFTMPLLNISNGSTAMLTAYAADDENYVDGSNDTFYYLKYSDHISISGLKSEKSDLVIPDTIDGLPVTKIQLYSFNYLSITSVKFPDSLKEIDSYSFTDCTNLTEVTLPANIERLGFHVFENCTSLETINFPDHPVKTADFTFDNTPWLTAQRQKSPLVIVNNALIDARTAKGDVTVPSNVQYVAGGAFSKNEDVTSVVLPTSVTEIGDSTFWMCSNLKSVDIKGAEVLGTMAFGYCSKLNELKLSKNLKTIKEFCFSDCSNSGTITFYGSESDWKNVQILDEDNFIKNAKIVYDSSSFEEVTGDINMDGAFNIADAVSLQKWLLNSPDAELKNPQAADLTGDNVLDVYDLIMIRKALIG